MPTDTRRAYDRLDITFDVVVHHADRELEATCLNISQGGMFVQTPEPLPIDAQLSVVFRLPDIAQPVTAQARVAWSEQKTRRGVGVQFLGLRAIEVWAINQLFRRRSKGEL
jgi:type IV pilus assembly protein PilZ